MGGLSWETTDSEYFLFIYFKNYNIILFINYDVILLRTPSDDINHMRSNLILSFHKNLTV